MGPLYSVICIMPELPEVETVMRGLQAVLQGRQLRRVQVHRPDLRWPFPVGLASELTGAASKSKEALTPTPVASDADDDKRNAKSSANTKHKE